MYGIIITYSVPNSNRKLLGKNLKACSLKMQNRVTQVRKKIIIRKSTMKQDNEAYKILFDRTSNCPRSETNCH